MQFSSRLCPEYITFPYGRVQYDRSPDMAGRYPVGTVVTFICNSGDPPIGGGPNRTCNRFGFWGFNRPTCNISGKGTFEITSKLKVKAILYLCHCCCHCSINRQIGNNATGWK